MADIPGIARTQEVESFYSSAHGNNWLPPAAGLVAVAIFGLRLLNRRQAEKHVWIWSWIGIPILLLITLGYLPYLLWRKPTVTLSPQGVSVTLPTFQFGLIPWGDIAEVAVVRSYKFDAVQLRLKNPNKFTNRFGILSKLVFALRPSTRGLISIPTMAIDVGADVLVRKVKGRMIS
jgi:hypothetical protein